MLRTRLALLLATPTLTAVFLSSLAFSQTAAPPKTSEQAFKNIQTLKGIPEDRVIPSMQFIANSLGVRCEHCHVEGAFDKDDKKPKQTARKMMEMVFALNKASFDGKREVTCYSCHRGSLRPVSVPIIGAETPAPKPAVVANAVAASEAEVLDKYLQTVGGPALQKVNSEVAKGKIVLGQGVEFPLEIYTRSPGMRSAVTHLANGSSMDVVNGESGWSQVAGRPVREMNSDEIMAGRLDADLRLASDIKSMFAEIKAEPDQEVAGRPASVLQASKPGQPPVEFYFDKQSGLLLRMVHYVDSPLGSNPTQIDYADYRDVNGVKIAFQWTTSRPLGHFTVQLDQVQLNVPIEDSKFTKPVETAAPQGH